MIKANKILIILIVLFSGTGIFAVEKPNEKQIGEIKAKLEQLFASKDNVFLSIEEKGTEKIIQIFYGTAGKKRNIVINIGYFPYFTGPKATFKNAKIKLPWEWEQINFEAGTFVEYHIPEAKPKELSEFINAVFINLFKSKADYELKMTIDKT